MQSGQQTRPDQPITVQVVLNWLYRAAAIYCLAFGLIYWGRLIGFPEDSGWRFDLMPVHWQVASAALAVLFPFAASGLWMLASWGPVIWFICAASETIMFIGFPELFGENFLAVTIHAAAAAVFIVLRGLHYYLKRASRD